MTTIQSPTYSCIFCNTTNNDLFCSSCTIKIINNKEQILTLFHKVDNIIIRPVEHKQPAFVKNNSYISPPTQNLTPAEYKQNFRDKQKAELGDEAYKKKMRDEKNGQRNGYDANGIPIVRKLKTPEEIAETNRLRQKRYNDKKRANKQ